MKLLYTTLSLATIGILVGCGPKSETTGIKKNDSIGVIDTTAKADVPPTPEKVILTAKGTEPLWTLIIGEKLIKFKLEDKDTVTASDYRMGDSTPTKQVYIGGKDFGITVEDKSATDVATGNKYAKTVSISFQGKQYKGYSGDVIGEDKPTATQTKPENPKAARYTVEGKWVLSTLMVEK